MNLRKKQPNVNLLSNNSQTFLRGRQMAPGPVLTFPQFTQVKRERGQSLIQARKQRRVLPHPIKLPMLSARRCLSLLLKTLFVTLVCFGWALL